MTKELLKELSNWKLEAKLEDNSRYFYHTSEFEEIKNGTKLYVIGRKGSGKTAISENFRLYSDYNYFSEKLTFKNFPFHELYKLNNDSYTKPNQFITIWKYIIYLHICKMMSRNESINTASRSILRGLFPSTETSLARLIPVWVGRQFEFSAFGVGAKYGSGQLSTHPVSWIDKTIYLEDFILSNCDKSSYFIVFDELDEDYKDVIEKFQSNEYIDLLVSLFKAVQDVRSIFHNKLNIFPIVFLRDDIYDLLSDADKNKWNDYKVDLQWDKNKVKSLLAFRISRAIDSECDAMPYEKAWKCVFEKSSLVPYGFRQRSRLEAFDFITRSTLIRPRDYVRYLQIAASEELAMGNECINGKTIRAVDKAFSNYLRNEFVDEIRPVIPDIEDILNAISRIRSPVFSVNRFKEEFEMSSKHLKTNNFDLVLGVLFHFSVLGNKGRQKGIEFFKYINKEASLNPKESLVVHRGLYKALQII